MGVKDPFVIIIGSMKSDFWQAERYASKKFLAHHVPTHDHVLPISESDLRRQVGSSKLISIHVFEHSHVTLEYILVLNELALKVSFIFRRFKFNISFVSFMIHAFPTAIYWQVLFSQKSNIYHS